MSEVVVVPAAALERWRREAKQLKKRDGIAHHSALDAVARRTGLFPDWHHLTEAARATEPAEEAFKRGFVVGIDWKIAAYLPEDKLGQFLDDPRLEHFVREDFGRLGHGSEADAREVAGAAYYRWGTRVPQTPQEAIVPVQRVFGTHALRYLRLRSRLLVDMIFSEDRDGPWRLEP